VTVTRVRSALAAHAAQELPARRRAAVAIVMSESPSGSRMLFIERARRASDPWSGQMAFPGGRVGAGDADARAAAERETREEVGLDLAGAEVLGQLDDLRAGILIWPPLVLSSFVYRIGAAPPLVPNHEVREALWVPVSRLLDPAHRVRYRWGLGRFPGILVGEPERHVVWGLTYQLVERLFAVVGVPVR